MEQKKIFPKDFYWGASTASHQVEGGTINQWSTWELANAAHLAKTAKQRLSWVPVWDEVKKQAEDPNNYVSGMGVNHYNRYKEDFDIAQQLNLNAFRFGIEWSRIEPVEGQWDENEIEHYREYIKELKKRGIEPFLNIWHWTSPTWFIDKGGFEDSSNLKYWRHFIEKVAEEYGDLLKYVLTINEPNVYVSNGYLSGEWPPAVQEPLKGMRVYWNLVKVHKQSYKILKRHNPKLQISSAMHLANIQAKRPHNLLDEFVTKAMRYGWNWWFLRRTRKQHDFIGFNYYFTDYYKGIHKQTPKAPLNDLGWYMEPEGIYPLIMRIWARYKKPIIITENGVADMHDQYRQWWIEETIVAMERALSEGVKVQGYLHWSLLDNFEWAQGWWPKFGLVEVERNRGMKRNIRPSAKWYAEKIKSLR